MCVLGVHSCNFFLGSQKTIIYLKPMSWTPFKWSQFPWQHWKHHGRSRLRYAFFPRRGVDLGHIRVGELLHSLLDLPLTTLWALCAVALHFLTTASKLKGNLMVVWWLGLFFLEHTTEGTRPSCRVAVFWATGRWKRYRSFSSFSCQLLSAWISWTLLFCFSFRKASSFLSEPFFFRRDSCNFK